MGTDAGVAAAWTETGAAPSRERTAVALTALTRRASLSAVASLLDYGAKAGVGLVITPILVGGLGRSLFGIWEMLGRLIGYMTATDGRPTEALRLVVAQRQAADDAGNRRYVGGAIVVWLLMLPLVAVAGVALAWVAPHFTHAPADQVVAVRVTSLLLVGSFLLGTLAAVPESVLRGMNLGYKRMGLQAGLSVIAGALAAGAVHGGLGLVGMGGAQIVRGLLTGIVFWLLVRKYVHWFGVARPTRAEVRALFGMSVWLSVGDLLTKLLLASDVLILGALISPAAVTSYALTGYAARTALGIHVFTAGAASPGLGGLLGQGHRVRVAHVRRELLTLTWLFAIAVGTTILLWNPSFLRLWVGERNYAGPWVNLLIVATMVQTAFIRTDAYIIDAALQPQLRVMVGAVSAAVTLALGIALTTRFGLLGLCAGMIAGRAIQSVAYPILVRRYLGAAAAGASWEGARLTALGGALLVAAAAGGEHLAASGWVPWLGGVAVTAVLAAGVALGLGPGPALRRAIVARIKAMTLGLRARGEPRP